MAEGKEEVKSLLMKVKEESEKAGLKLNIHYIDSSNPWTWYISPSISVLFDLFHQCFIVFYI